LKRTLYIVQLSLCWILIVIASLYTYITLCLPSVAVLADARMQVPLRIYTQDNQLISEYGDQRRIPLAFADIPPSLINAVLATEDKRFFSHSGIDVFGLARAGLIYLSTGKKSQGGSTITMQVARNFFLTRQKSFYRKFKEILLAIKIDHTFSKQKILELYFNKVFLGKHAYGFGAAAQVYYGKPLSQLSLAQYAMLAGLPKAPSSGNPISNPKHAIDRRNHVLYRMLESQQITQAQYDAAIAEPVTARYHVQTVDVPAPYVAEIIGKELTEHFGRDVYAQGLQIHTTISSKDQKAANAAVQNALFNYDKRHGFRKPTTNLGLFSPDEIDQWMTTLQAYHPRFSLQAAAVIDVSNTSVQALLANGNLITIDWAGLSWARPASKHGWPGPAPKKAAQILNIGDVIWVKALKNNRWALSQLPEVEGALVAMNPQTGAVMALVGGLDFEKSKFNRATQAKRQIGSSIKPFIYAAALDKDMTLASIVNDAPIVIQDSGEHKLWRPQNDTKKFYGPTRLREALAKSRNLVSIRVLQHITLPYTLSYLTRFGFDKTRLPNGLSLALGTANFTPLEMANAYSVFANGGYFVPSYLITHITDDQGHTLYQANPTTVCPEHKPKPQADTQENCAKRVINPQTAYLMTQAMAEVIHSGTGRAARSLNRKDLAGKTGTTDDQNDAWFAGFNHSLVAISWVGYDTPQSLYEYGAQTALPMWIDFMRIALRHQPTSLFTEPNDIITVRIDPKTGLIVGPQHTPVMYEKFRRGHLPKKQPETVEDQPKASNTTDNASNNLGGLY